jgi:hypothetical protein
MLIAELYAVPHARREEFLALLDRERQPGVIHPLSRPALHDEVDQSAVAAATASGSMTAGSSNSQSHQTPAGRTSGGQTTQRI